MLCIGIPTINNLKYLKQAVESIKTAQPWKLLIVDNLSTDGARDWIRESEYDYILNPRNYGVAPAWNQILHWGMSQEGCDLVIVLNNDIVLHENALDLMWQTINENGKEAVSGVNVGNSPLMLESCTRPAQRYSPAMNFSCFGLTPETIKRVGFFDEGFKLGYFEDNDYHHRMMLEGIDGVCDMWAFFAHYGSRTIKEAGVRHEPYFSQNRKYFKEKWGFTP